MKYVAVEGMTIDMIPFLTADKVRELYEEYRKIPRSLRVPVMKAVLFSAKKDAKAPPMAGRTVRRAGL